ncbi:MAG: hypothetical protein FD177_317 [Desulfovibrionaceae bacterium]|nr:MAG: hypothetical protein FD177_317 [Desulfovibrionaceae bacterium]
MTVRPFALVGWPHNFFAITSFKAKRRANVVGIFPNEQSIIRLIGAILLEQKNEWQLQSRYMQVEAMVELNTQINEVELTQIPPEAA